MQLDVCYNPFTFEHKNIREMYYAVNVVKIEQLKLFSNRLNIIKYNCMLIDDNYNTIEFAKKNGFINSVHVDKIKDNGVSKQCVKNLNKIIKKGN